MKRVCWLGLALTVACSEALEQTSSAGQVIGVVNAADNTLSFVSATGFSVRTVDLGTPGGAATTAGASWLNAFACCSVSTLDSIPLSGTNARFLAVGDDSLLYVVAAGRAGHPEGKLSVVDPVTGTELVVINGLGDSPGAAAFHPSGRVLVASATEGILEVNTLTRSVTRGPGQGVKPGGHGVAGLAIDQGGRVYALDAGGCTGPGVVHVLSPPPDYDELRAVTVGVCPSATALAVVP